jgi:lipopolysaccharide export system protein LptA
VRTVLVSNESASGKNEAAKSGAGKSPAATNKAEGAKASGGKTDVVRIASRELVYSDELRRADFTGGVEVHSADGIMHGQQAVVYLKPAPVKADGGKAVSVSAKPASAATGLPGGFMGGSVDHIVATGHIDMEQPGRRATGEQVVYTANDGWFNLTGTPTVPPKVIDEQRGTVTGASLRFHSGDENVVVSNGEGAGQRVHTETRVKNK